MGQQRWYMRQKWTNHFFFLQKGRGKLLKVFRPVEDLSFDGFICEEQFIAGNSITERFARGQDKLHC